MDPELEAWVIKALARRYGYSDEEAKAFVDAIREREGEVGLERLVANLKVLASASEEVAKVESSEVGKKMMESLMPAVTLKALGALSDDGRRRTDIQELAERITIIKTLLGGNESSALEERLRALEERIEKIASDEQRKVIRKIVAPFIKRLRKYDELDKKFEELRAELRKVRANPTPAKVESFAERVKKVREELEEFMKAAETLGFKVVKPSGGGGEEDINEVVEKLRKYGYEVRPPPTWQDIEDMIQQERERIKKELEQELRIQEKKLKTLGAVGVTIVNAILSALAPEMSKSFESLEEALWGGEGGGGGGEGEEQGGQ